MFDLKIPKYLKPIVKEIKQHTLPTGTVGYVVILEEGIQWYSEGEKCFSQPNRLFLTRTQMLKDLKETWNRN
ncbi:hypothetical protein [Pectinatus frisingensis]|uniref:hypothetical protein n=1 Tax=Pectinatus frisingensis TaxID=865 RepID=UPI0018C50062|nr:hypothetical protein [Pectinatus frisingensis]